MQAVTRYYRGEDWLTFVLIGALFLLVLAKMLYPKRFSLFLILPINNKYHLLFGKKDSLWHPFHILTTAVQVIALSVFLRFGIKLVKPDWVLTIPWFFAVLVLALLFFLLIKILIQKTIASIFEIEEPVDTYVFEKMSYLNCSSLILLVIDFLFQYSFEPNALIYSLCFALFVVINLVGWVSAFKISQKLILENIFYIILYLCALELAPYVLVAKYFLF